MTFNYTPRASTFPSYAEADITCTITGPPQNAQEVLAWACVGKIASAAAIIDQILNDMIWHLIGVKPELGACITSQLSSNHNRFIALESILRELGAQQGIVDRLSKLSLKWKDLGERRNRAVHDPLAWDEARQEMRILRIVTRPQQELTYDLLPFSAEDCFNTTIKLQNFYNDIAQFRIDAFTALQPSAEISLPQRFSPPQGGQPQGQAKKHPKRQHQRRPSSP